MSSRRMSSESRRHHQRPARASVHYTRGTARQIACRRSLSLASRMRSAWAAICLAPPSMRAHGHQHVSEALACQAHLAVRSASSGAATRRSEGSTCSATSSTATRVGIFGPGRTIGRPGAEASFALDMLRVPSATRGPGRASTTPDRVGIVKAAVIASGVRSWVQPENSTTSKNIPGYFEALVRDSICGGGLPAFAELDTSVCASVLGMLWVQGEADARKDR